MAKKTPNQVNNAQNSLRNLTNSPNLHKSVDTLFKVLHQNNARSAFEFTGNLESELDWRNGKGILFQMANPSNRIVQDLEFQELKNEVMYLDELEDIVQNGLQMPNSSTLGAGFEEVLIEEVKREFRSLIDQNPKIKPLKSDFLSHIDGVNGFAPLMEMIRGYAGNLNNTDQKREFEKLIKDYKISFSTISQRLEKKGYDLSSLKNPYSQWSDEQKLLWDGVFSQLVIGRFQERLDALNGLLEQSVGLFDKALPSFSIFFEKYPFDYKVLQQKYPEKWQTIEQLQKQAGEAKDEASLEQINLQIQNAEFAIYLEDLASQNAGLAKILEKLVKGGGDFGNLQAGEQQILMKEFLDITLQKYKDKNLTQVFDQMGSGSDFEAFFRELFDLQKTTLKVGGVELPLSKKIVSSQPYGLQNLEAFAQMELPLEFEVKELDKAPLSVENRAALEKLFATEMSDDKKSIKLGSGDLGKLLYLWVMSNQEGKFENFARKELADKGIGNLFEQKDANVSRLGVDQLKDQLQSEETQQKETEKKPEKTPEEDIESEIKGLNEYWNTIKGGKSELGPQVGDLLYFEDDQLNSVVPPFDVGGGDGSREKIRMEITQVKAQTGEISFKICGTELALSKKDEGVEHAMRMSSFVKTLKERKSLIKIPRSQQNAEGIVLSLAGAEVGADKLGGVRIKDGKLMFDQYDEEGKASEQEATHFAVYDKVSDQKSGFKREKIVYQVKPLGNGQLEVSGDVPDMNGETKRYRKTMKLSDFLLFVANKHLLPKTKDQVEAEIKSQGEVPGKKEKVWKWMSIRAMTSSIKTVWKNFTAKIEARYKEQDEACLNWLVDDFAIYDKIAKLIPAPIAKGAAKNLRDEAIAKLEGKNWGAIEDWLKKFEGMVDFATFFRTGKDDFTGIGQEALGGKTLQQILESGQTVVNNPALRPIMAAAMIANVRKGAGLYRNVQGGENKALWIKCLLGDDHHKRYMEMKNDVIARIQAGAADADQLQDRLKNSEIDYIVNNIRGADVGLDFGSVSNNDRTLRKIYSDKFAGTLDGEKKSPDKEIQEAYSKIGHQNFEKAFNDFKGMIKSGRFERGVAQLMKMVDLTGKSKERMDIVRRAFSFIVLSGMMNRYGGDKKTRKFFNQLAITLQVPTAFGVTKWDHRDNAWHLMNKIPPAEGQKSFGQYLEEKGLKKSDFSHRSGKIDYAGFMDHLWHRRDMNEVQVDKYFDSLFIREGSFDPIEKKVKDQLWKTQSDNVYGAWAGNPALMSIKPLQKGAEVFKENMKYDKDGFIGNSVDAKNDKAMFRKDLTAELKTKEKDIGPKEMMQLFLKIFNAVGFSEANYPTVISYLRTARRVVVHQNQDVVIQKSESERFNAGKYQPGDARDLLDYLFRGRVLTMRNAAPPSEFANFINVFVKYFQNNLEKFDEQCLQEIFGLDALNDTSARPRILIPWEEYNKYKVPDILPGWDEEESQSESFADANNKKGKNKRKAFYDKKDLFLNKELADLESKMEKIGVKTSSLSGFSKDKVASFVDSVYGILD